MFTVHLQWGGALTAHTVCLGNLLNTRKEAFNTHNYTALNGAMPWHVRWAGYNETHDSWVRTKDSSTEGGYQELLRFEQERKER